MRYVGRHIEMVVQAKRSNESLGGMLVIPNTDVTKVSGRKLLESVLLSTEIKTD